MRLASFCEALRLAMVEAVPDEFHPEFPLLNDRLGLGYRAWASVLAGFGLGTTFEPGGNRQLAFAIPDIKWKTPEANQVYENLTTQAKANGTLQDLGLSHDGRSMPWGKSIPWQGWERPGKCRSSSFDPSWMGR